MVRYILVLIFLIPSMLFSQQIESTFEGSTHMVSPDELFRLNENGKGFTPTAPPSGTVRNIAEFEPNQGVIVGYPGQFGIPVNLIAEMSEVAVVYTIVPDQNTQNQLTTYYASNGVDIQNCIFVHAPLDSYWSRDYGPWFIADSSNNVAIVDFPYNRPRPNDNNVPVVMANFLGVDIYGMNVEHTGGNYMTDGMGISASTTLVSAENSSLTTAQINQYLQDFLGIHTYHLMNDPLGAYIEHIDCWAKFLAVDKVLVGEVPTSDSRYADFEASANYFKTHNCSYGYPYKVYRTYSPNGQPYTNSFILNNKVLVPLVTNYGVPWNDSALAVYQRAMPGYEIVGVYGLGSSPWQSTDALHCRVHELPDTGMLYIRHMPYYDTTAQQSVYEIRGTIIPYSDSALIADSLLVYYKYDNGGWHSIKMVHDVLDDYVGSIPDSAGAVKLSYYIHAADQSGRRISHPYMEEHDPHKFDILNTSGFVNRNINKNFSSVFPNPCDNLLFIKIPNRIGSAKATIYAIDGKKVAAYDIRQLSSGGVTEIDTYTLKEGIYLIEITTDNMREVHKIAVFH